MDYEVEQEIIKIWRALKCKANCGDVNNLTADNGLTKTVSNIQLGGNLTKDTTIETSGNNLKISETTANIIAGVYNNPASGNRAWNVMHSDSGFNFLFSNKFEDIPIGTIDADGLGMLVYNDSDNSSAFSGVFEDKATGDLFDFGLWNDSTGLDGFLRILDKNGFAIHGSSNSVLFKVNNKTVYPTLPEYVNDAAADADVTLLSGGLYKVTRSRGVFQKP